MIRLITIGKLKNPHYQSLCADYGQRLSHYTSCEILELREPATKLPQKKVEEESQLILKKITKIPLVILLDEKGSSINSMELAKLIDQNQQFGGGKMAVIIGGAYGVSAELKKKVHRTLSLSDLTFPHELARVVALEQLYRAHTILKGEKYHH